MTPRLTKKQEKMKRLSRKLWKDCIPDEMKAAATYRRIARELEELGLYDSARAINIIAESEEAHKDMLNSIIDLLNQRVQIEELPRHPKEAIKISKKYTGVKGTVKVRYENGSIRLLPRRNYLMMRDAGRDVTEVK